MKRIVSSFIALFMLTACAIQDILVVGETMPATDPETIQVYLMDKPDCDFYVIANIQIPGDTHSRASLINSFKNTAARFGATMVQVTSIRKINVSEFMGTARALRCNPIQLDGFNNPQTSNRSL